MRRLLYSLENCNNKELRSQGGLRIVRVLVFEKVTAKFRK